MPLLCKTLLPALLTACGLARPATAAEDSPNAALASTLSRLIRDSIPSQYEKQTDWGATKDVTVGIRPAGKPSDLHLKRHKKQVNHGVWKHYKLTLVEPEQNLLVQVTDLRPIAPGRMAFTLHIESPLDAWARAKVYQYGVHLIALEMESDARVSIDVAGEIGLQIAAVHGAPGVIVQPLVKDAKLALADFHLRRVSNARGPLVHELSEGVRRFVEDEINGQLVAKLNAAIDKKKDRLAFSAADLIKSDWSPLSRVSVPKNDSK